MRCHMAEKPKENMIKRWAIAVEFFIITAFALFAGLLSSQIYCGGSCQFPFLDFTWGVMYAVMFFALVRAVLLFMDLGKPS